MKYRYITARTLTKQPGIRRIQPAIETFGTKRWTDPLGTRIPLWAKNPLPKTDLKSLQEFELDAIPEKVI